MSDALSNPQLLRSPGKLARAISIALRTARSEVDLCRDCAGFPRMAL